MIVAPIVVVAVLACPSSSSPAEPVAVAPWRNLNDDGALRWLEQGAAETVAADLKRAGVHVVERAQIAEALAQVASHAKDDVAGAVAAGRIVGAKSIVLGSFQRANKDIRLVARVVDVETGNVAEAAKATGAVDDIFRLQDQIVASLSNKPPPKRATKPKVQAYEKLALSLTATNVDDARALLTASLAVDPDFVYAKDALAALETRMRESAAQSAPAWDAREAALLAIVDDKRADGARRTQAASALLDGLDKARRFHALIGAADRVVKAGVAADVVDDVNEHASALRVKALVRLAKPDLALQAGERHLALFPAGMRRADVEKIMHDVVDDKRTLDQRRKEFDDELRDGAATHDALARDFHPCIAAKWSKLPDEMLARCTKFLAVHARDADADARDHVVSARAYVAWAHAMKGDFATAHNEARALEADVAGALEASGLRSVVDTWPTD